MFAYQIRVLPCWPGFSSGPVALLRRESCPEGSRQLREEPGAALAVARDMASSRALKYQAVGNSPHPAQPRGGWQRLEHTHELGTR